MIICQKKRNMAITVYAHRFDQQDSNFIPSFYPAKQWKVTDICLMTDGISLGMSLFNRIMDSALVFLLRDVTRYRFNVIRNNLKEAFVYDSESALKEDISGNYRFMAKIIRQVIFKASHKKLDKKLSIKPSP